MLKSCWCVTTDWDVIIRKQYFCSPVTSATTSLHNGHDLLQSKHIHTHTGKRINTHYCLGLQHCTLFWLSTCRITEIVCAGLMLHTGKHTMTYAYSTSFLFYNPLWHRRAPFSEQFTCCYKPQIHCHNQGSQCNISGTNCPILWQKKRWRGTINRTTLPWCNLRITTDVHNRSLALVAVEILSGKLQRQTEKEKRGDGVQHQP